MSFPDTGLLLTAILTSPHDVACGLHLDILPIAIICATLKEAFKVDVLNSEIFTRLNDPDDAEEVRAAIKSSKSVGRVFRNGEKIYALRVGSETGIYGGFDW